MPAPISVIIPTLNAGQSIGPCLVSLAEALTAGLLAEVILADGGSSDDTQEIADEVGARFLSAPKGRGNQMHAAATQARGEWLLFLHADSNLSEGWAKPVQAHLSRPKTAAYFHLKFDEQSLPARIVATWANLRARAFSLPYGDQGLLISRRLYDEIGGFPTIPLMEDVAIARKLRGRLHALPATITTSAERYRRDGWAKQSLRNFVTLVRFKTGTSPDKLTKDYNR